MGSIAIDPLLDHESNYPLFGRSVSSLLSEVQAVVTYLRNLGVAHVGLVYVSWNHFGPSYSQALQREADKVGITVKGSPYTFHDNVGRSTKEAVSIMKSAGYRCFLALPDETWTFTKI